MPNGLISQNTFIDLELEVPMTSSLVLSVLRLARYTARLAAVEERPVINNTSLPLAPPGLKKHHQFDPVLMIGRPSVSAQTKA